jgi:hypothetical protein
LGEAVKECQAGGVGGSLPLDKHDRLGALQAGQLALCDNHFFDQEMLGCVLGPVDLEALRRFASICFWVVIMFFTAKEAIFITLSLRGGFVSY